MALNNITDLWAITHVPAAATQATISRAAAAGVRHVAMRLILQLSTVAATAQTPINWSLRDGATGAGTRLAAGTAAALGTTFVSIDIDLSRTPLIGTANTAMTLEWDAAGVANSLETVTLIGYDF